ncbi:hypothetical protein G6F59_016079 [Rhizopus arrhizus]|nr:hypothetical protein G6F59_016079 [Rhizopus arrhizus]
MQIAGEVGIAAIAEPVAVDPVHALRAALQSGAGGEHQHAVVAERCGDAAQYRAHRVQRAGAFQRQQRRHQRGHPDQRPASASSRVRAASLPSALPASGLSPVSSRRSCSTLPSMPSLTICTPCCASRSPKNHCSWPGM